MNLKVWIKWMSLTTVIALIYIHMQMQIFDLAYQGEDKEKRMHELRDINGLLTHQILTLKSVNHLGNQLLEKKSSLQFISHDAVMTLTAPVSMTAGPSGLPVKSKNVTPWWNFLSLLAPQDARAWDNQ